MNSFIPDKFAQTARLLVKITDGVCTSADGNPLPKLKPGTTAELIISAWDVTDDAARARLLAENTVEFLQARTSVWARVKKDEIPKGLASYHHHKNAWPKQPGVFVEIQLLSPVSLVIRGGGRASLSECGCGIPALPDLECISINEAYTRISESFEPSRRSHSGNIFSCVFYEVGNFLYPLRKRRDEKLASPCPK